MPQRRNTHQRQLVLEAVRAHWNHPTADEIYSDVRTRDEHISRATVYRNLHLLVDEGRVKSVKAPGGERFDQTLSNHSHVICLKCGKVEDANSPFHEELDAQVARGTGYQVFGHEVMFQGICPACQAAQVAATA